MDVKTLLEPWNFSAEPVHENYNRRGIQRFKKRLSGVREFEPKPEGEPSNCGIDSLDQPMVPPPRAKLPDPANDWAARSDWALASTSLLHPPSIIHSLISLQYTKTTASANVAAAANNRTPFTCELTLSDQAVELLSKSAAQVILLVLSILGRKLPGTGGFVLVRVLLLLMMAVGSLWSSVNSFNVLL